MLLNHSGSKAEWFRTDSGTSYQLSKSKASLSSRVASKQLCNYSEREPECQHWKKDFLRFPQGRKTARASAESTARYGPVANGDWSHPNGPCIAIFLAAAIKLLCSSENAAGKKRPRGCAAGLMRVQKNNQERC
jgi:hypothetical protein